MKKKSTRIPLLYIGIIALIALPLSLIAVQRQTFTRQEAAEEVDVNSAAQIASTNNPDGTMGPESSEDNFSSEVTAAEKGELSVETTDFFKANGQDVSEEENVDEVEEGNVGSTTGKGKSAEHKNKGKGKKNLEFIAINLTISKAEVHLAKLASDTTSDEEGGDEEETSEQNTTEAKPSTAVSHGQPTGTQTHGKGKSKVKGDATTSGQVSQAKAHGKGHWETLTINAPLTIDLVQLATDGDIKSLGLTDLAAGKYTEIRLYVSSASATLADGTTVTLEIPGKNNIVRIVKPFTVVAGQTTKLLISVNSKKSVIKAGNKYMLKPVIARMLVNKPAGENEGEE